MTIRKQLTVIAMAIGATIASARAEVRVVGSDLLGVEFSKALYDFAGRSSLTVALAFDGSRPALDELKAGRADLALLTLPAAEELAAPAFHSLPIAYHRVVILAPAACPLPQLTLDQVTGIFGAGGGAAVIDRWGDLGLGGDWATAPVGVLAPEVGAGVVLEYFRHAVLRDRELRANAVRYRDPVALQRRFSGEARALALAAAPLAEPAPAKVVPLAARAGYPAFLPTPENLHSGDYPLRLPLRLVFRREITRELRSLLAFLLGDEAAAHFARAGVVPLPATARAQQLAAVQKM
jgi:phosphate transport system substrate-binding protein